MWFAAAGLRVSEVVALKVTADAISRFLQFFQTRLDCRDTGPARARSNHQTLGGFNSRGQSQEMRGDRVVPITCPARST